VPVGGEPVVVKIYSEIEEAVVSDINRQIGSLLAVLHDQELEEFGYLGVDGVVDGHETNLAYMRFQFAKKLREFSELGGDDDLAAAIERYAAEREDLLTACQQPSLCHNDCLYGNVIVVEADDGWRVSGIVDWENAVAGDPLFDLSKTHCYAQHWGEATLAALIEGHGAAREAWRETIDLYVVYHLLELWTWFASTGRAEPLDGIAADLRGAVRRG
jgi:aminoglycoside phosphotransferase (APT) family kinase protein